MPLFVAQFRPCMRNEGSMQRLDGTGIPRRMAATDKGWDVSESCHMHRASPSPLRAGWPGAAGTGGGPPVINCATPTRRPCGPAAPPPKGGGGGGRFLKPPPPPPVVPDGPTPSPHGGGRAVTVDAVARNAPKGSRLRAPPGPPREEAPRVGQLASRAAISARNCSMPNRVWLEVTIRSGCAAGRLAMAALVAAIALSRSLPAGLSALVSTIW